MKIGKYLYGIIPRQNKLELALDSIMPTFGDIHTIDYKELSALVSNAPIKVYNPEKELILRHEKVVASVMKETTIIPARYGIVARKAAEVGELLEANYDYLFEKTKELENKVELSLRIFWRKDKLADDIQSEELRKIKMEADSQQKLDQATQIKLGEIAFQVVEDKREQYIRQIYEPLKQKAISAKLNNILNVRMVCNCAFLVSREDEPKFDALVNALYLEHAQVLDFKYSGPWPPYNFVDLVLTFSS